jgi:hypothetical protein
MQNQEFVNQQMQACKVAEGSMKNPVNVLIQPLKEYINQGSVNDRPVVSFDGSTMAYTERRGLESVIFTPPGGRHHGPHRWTSPGRPEWEPTAIQPHSTVTVLNFTCLK